MRKGFNSLSQQPVSVQGQHAYCLSQNPFLWFFCLLSKGFLRFLPFRPSLNVQDLLVLLNLVLHLFFYHAPSGLEVSSNRRTNNVCAKLPISEPQFPRSTEMLDINPRQKEMHLTPSRIDCSLLNAEPEKPSPAPTVRKNLAPFSSKAVTWQHLACSNSKVSACMSCQLVSS